MKKLESGRSMVEMLGVLAIIGVLSIGGIAGYVLSMNRYRANNILDTANRYASLAFSSYQTWVAQGRASSEWSKPTLASYKLTVPENSNVELNLATSSSKASEAILDSHVSLKLTFPSKDVCETAIGILGLEDGTDANFSDGTPKARKCTKATEVQEETTYAMEYRFKQN